MGKGKANEQDRVKERERPAPSIQEMHQCSSGHGGIRWQPALWSSCQVPGTILSTSHVSSHLTVRTTSCVRYAHHAYFTGEETEAESPSDLPTITQHFEKAQV